MTETGQSRPATTNDRMLLVALGTATFLAALNFFAISPFTTEIAADLDTSVALIGQITMLMILTSAVLGLAIGPVTDQIGHRMPLVAGMVAVGINLIGLSLATNYYLMIALAIVGGFADAIVFSLPFAIISARLAPDRQARAVSTAFAALSAAPILGTPLLTFVGSLGSWRTALAVAGVVAVAAAFFAYSVIPPDTQTTHRSTIGLRHILDAYLPIWRDPNLSGLMISTLLRSVTWIGAITYLGALFDEQFGLSTRAVGLIFTVTGIGAITGSMIGGRFRGMPLRNLALVAFVGIGVFTCVVFASDHRALAIVGVFLAACCSTVGNVTSGSLIMRESRAGAGTTMVLNGTMINFGSALGAALGGLLLHKYGYRGIGIGLPIFSFAAAVILVRTAQSAKERPVAPV